MHLVEPALGMRHRGVNLTFARRRRGHVAGIKATGKHEQGQDQHSHGGNMLLSRRNDNLGVQIVRIDVPARLCLHQRHAILYCEFMTTTNSVVPCRLAPDQPCESYTSPLGRTFIRGDWHLVTPNEANHLRTIDMPFEFANEADWPSDLAAELEPDVSPLGPVNIAVKPEEQDSSPRTKLLRARLLLLAAEVPDECLAEGADMLRGLREPSFFDRLRALCFDSLLTGEVIPGKYLPTLPAISNDVKKLMMDALQEHREMENRGYGWTRCDQDSISWFNHVRLAKP